MKNKNLIFAVALLLLLGGCEGIKSSTGGQNESSSSRTGRIRNSSESQSSNVSYSSSVFSQPEEDSKWNVNFSEYGETFRATLASLINGYGTTTCSYHDCLAVGAKAAAYPNSSSSTFVPFYHSTSETLATTSQCNREHTWPNARGGGAIETDPFVIRPTFNSDNSSRGCNFYGNEAKNEFDPKSLGFEGARGEAARVILYAATRYKNKGLSLSNNPGDSTGKKTMGTLKTLLKWNREYKVTAIEQQINDYLASKKYGRNPFVDHPEYAEYIWTESGVRTVSVNTSISYSAGSESYEKQSSSSITGTTYNVFKDLSSLDGKTLAIASDYNEDFYALTSTPVSSDRPWYLAGTPVASSSSRATITGQNIEFFKFTKVNESTFTIQSTKTNKYLYNYKSGTHLSISFDDSVSHDGELSKNWVLSAKGEGFTFKGSLNIYLQYSSYGNFSGYKEAPSSPICLYC